MWAVNDIYDKADFDGIKLINFKVKSLKVSWRVFCNFAQLERQRTTVTWFTNTYISNSNMSKLFLMHI